MTRRHTISFFHATAGLIYALGSQPNFKVHLFFSSLAVLAGIFLSLSAVEWAIIAVTIITGLVVELVNTAVEAVVDLVTQEWRQNAKIAKDTSAAAMLVYAAGSIVVAAIIFVPKLIAAWRSASGL